MGYMLFFWPGIYMKSDVTRSADSWVDLGTETHADS